MADPKQLKSPIDDDEDGGKQHNEGGKEKLVKDHYRRNHPHDEVPEVLATNTVSKGVHVVKLQGPHGPYHALLLEDGDTSTLIGKQ